MTRPPRSSLLAATILLALGGEARAIELRLPGNDRVLSVTLIQTLISEYHADVDPLAGNDNERYFDFKNRSDIVLLHGTTSLNLRIDANAFIGAPDGSPHQNRASFEKITLASAQRLFDVTAGDFPIRVGRGLALDLTRVNELFRDTTLRGAQFRIRSRYVTGVAFGGWANPLDVDDFTEVPVRVPVDVIGGARIEARPLPYLVGGLHYVGGGTQAQTGSDRHATHTLGVSFELPELWKQRLSLYGEFDFMSRAQNLEIVNGYGTYLQGSGNFGPFAVLLEFKFYKHLLFMNDFGSEVDTFIYNRPPTLTRTRAEVINNHDVIGPRLRLDYRLERLGTVFYVNYGHFFRSDAGVGQSFFQSGVNVYDAYAGAQQPLPGGALDVAGGFRIDKRSEAGESVTDYSQAFAEAEVSLVVWRNHSLEAELQYRKVEKAAEAYSDIYIGIGYRPNRWVSGGFSYEYSTEFKDPVPEDEVGVRRHYGGVRATINFTPSSYARLFGGTTHGGVRCVDGFCREFPPFIGFKMELVAQL